MEDVTAIGCASLDDQLEARAAVDARQLSFARPPELDGVAFDPWADCIERPEGRGPLVIDPNPFFQTRASDRNLIRPPVRSPGCSDDNGDVDEHTGRLEESNPPPRPQETSSGSAGSNTVASPGGKAGASAADTGHEPPAARAKDYWAAQLDDEARAAFERKAALAERRRQKFNELKQLSERVKEGDQAAMGEIQRILDGDEDFWRCYGDAGVFTESLLIDAISAGMVAVEESVRRSVANMKQSLLGANPTPLEEMTVQRVVACWLFMQFMDRCSTAAVQRDARASDLGKLQESAEKRYQTSLRTLKLIKGLESPADRQSKAPEAPPPAEQTAAA